MSETVDSTGAAAVERPNIFCAPTRTGEREDGAAPVAGIFASGTYPLAELPPVSAARRRSAGALARAGWVALTVGAVLALGAAVVVAVGLLRTDADRSYPIASTPDARPVPSLGACPRAATAAGARRWPHRRRVRPRHGARRGVHDRRGEHDRRRRSRRQRDTSRSSAPAAAAASPPAVPDPPTPAAGAAPASRPSGPPPMGGTAPPTSPPQGANRPAPARGAPAPRTPRPAPVPAGAPPEFM